MNDFTRHQLALLRLLNKPSKDRLLKQELSFFVTHSVFPYTNTEREVYVRILWLVSKFLLTLCFWLQKL